MKKVNKTKCSFCNKTLTKEIYNIKDQYNHYLVCGDCNKKVDLYKKEYDEKSKKLGKTYTGKLDNLSNRLRRKYNLKKHK